MLSIFPILPLGPDLYTVLSREYILKCCFPNDGTQDLFSLLLVCWKPSFAQFVLYLRTISVTVCLLLVEADTMGYRVHSEVHLKTNKDW